MALVFHIAVEADWDEAERRGLYVVPSLDREGFIHCSTSEQVIDTANAFFPGRRDLVLLFVDDQRTTAEVRDEPSADAQHGGTERGEVELFPHLYGPLNLDAVVAVEPLRPGSDGTLTVRSLRPFRVRNNAGIPRVPALAGYPSRATSQSSHAALVARRARL